MSRKRAHEGCAFLFYVRGLLFGQWLDESSGGDLFGILPSESIARLETRLDDAIDIRRSLCPHYAAGKLLGVLLVIPNFNDFCDASRPVQKLYLVAYLKLPGGGQRGAYKKNY